VAGRSGSKIEILTLQALALREKGEKERAGSILTQALTLAEPEGYVRIFVDEGSQMVPLLSDVLREQQKEYQERPDRPSAHYLRKLLAALEQAASGTTPPSAALPEPLSERELECLSSLKPANQTAGSPKSCSSLRARSRLTSATSTASSRRTAARKPWCEPGN
jgi:LuxR family transcriptional regulator, maltose regulon positive regulatory protein